MSLSSHYPHWRTLRRARESGIPAATLRSLSTLTKFLHSEMMTGLERRYAERSADLLDRVNEEWNVVIERKLVGYLSVLWLINDHLKRNGFVTGPGYGAMAGSVIAYALGLTQIDPLAHDLCYEPWLLNSLTRLPLAAYEVGCIKAGQDFLDSRLALTASSSALGLNQMTMSTNEPQPLVRLLESKAIFPFVKQAESVANPGEAWKATADFADKHTFQLISSGETEGVSYLDGNIRGFAKRLKPASFSDLVALLALYQPKAVNSRLLHTFIEARNATLRRSHRSIESQTFADDTYGLIIFDSQILTLLRTYAGFQPSEAMRAYRDLRGGQQKVESIWLSHFIEGASRRGKSIMDSKVYFNALKIAAPNAGLHALAVSRATTAYRHAYMKAHHPAA